MTEHHIYRLGSVATAEVVARLLRKEYGLATSPTTGDQYAMVTPVYNMADILVGGISVGLAREMTGFTKGVEAALRGGV